ncbi:MAG: MarR family transcriptional regulator [Solirubrobacterales bacterium]|nr:MarR family transcriptional regulator [Solirubrobacterales bacterium]
MEDMTRPHAEAWQLMHRLFMSQRRRFVSIAADEQLSPPQMGALMQLDPSRPVPMGDLADTLGCDSSNVTGIVDRLEGRGLVERRAAEHDRRVKMLAVTGDGVAVRERFKTAMGEPAPAIEHLSDADARALRDLLRRALGEDR